MRGRTVKIYLVDGVPGGLATAEIMNWTGKFTVAPRSQLADLFHRNDLRRTGIYFLIGRDPDDPSQEIVYIGETDNILDRLIRHNKNADKNYWEKTVIVTSKDENFTKAHARYLESRLIQIANQTKRAQVKNETNPDITSLPEPDIADMEYFLEQIQMLLPVLGFTFANPLPIIKPASCDETSKGISPIFCLSYGGANAKAQEIRDEFVILEGSSARKAKTPSLADSYIHIREKLVKDGSLADGPDKDFWVFTRNVPFQSPSTAANIIGGASLNGRQHWKVLETSQTYAQWQEEQIEKAGESAPVVEV
jgi:predicted GIY-YIG superfamily endonuclease